MCRPAVYMALTLVAEAGFVQRLYHGAHQRVIKHWHRQRRRPPAVGRRSSSRDVEASAADAEDEDVRAERDMIQSGGHVLNPWQWFEGGLPQLMTCVVPFLATRRYPGGS